METTYNKKGNKLYVIQTEQAVEISYDMTGVDYVLVQPELLADFAKLNPTIATKLRPLNYYLLRVTLPEWEDILPTPELAWSSSQATVQIGETNTYPTLSNPYSVEVTYSSSDEAVATIANDGTVTLLADGNTTISAIFAGSEEYSAQVVIYTLTVQEQVLNCILTTRTGLAIFDETANNWVTPTQLVTNPELSTLELTPDGHYSIDTRDGIGQGKSFVYSQDVATGSQGTVGPEFIAPQGRLDINLDDDIFIRLASDVEISNNDPNKHMVYNITKEDYYEINQAAPTNKIAVLELNEGSSLEGEVKWFSNWTYNPHLETIESQVEQIEVDGQTKYALTFELPVLTRLNDTFYIALNDGTVYEISTGFSGGLYPEYNSVGGGWATTSREVNGVYKYYWFGGVNLGIESRQGQDYSFDPAVTLQDGGSVGKYFTMPASNLSITKLPGVAFTISNPDQLDCGNGVYDSNWQLDTDQRVEDWKTYHMYLKDPNYTTSGLGIVIQTDLGVSTSAQPQIVETYHAPTESWQYTWTQRDGQPTSAYVGSIEYTTTFTDSYNVSDGKVYNTDPETRSWVEITDLTKCRAGRLLHVYLTDTNYRVVFSSNVTQTAENINTVNGHVDYGFIMPQGNVTITVVKATKVTIPSDFDPGTVYNRTTNNFENHNTWTTDQITGEYYKLFTPDVVLDMSMNPDYPTDSYTPNYSVTVVHPDQNAWWFEVPASDVEVTFTPLS